MKTTKLGPNLLAVLKSIAAGERETCGTNDRHLAKRGLVEWVATETTFNKYRLTDAGRAAVAKETK